MEMIRVEEITKNYKKVRALKGVSLSIEEGELFGLLGVNGAGKTTLMKMILGTLFPTEGEMTLFNDSNLNLERKRIFTFIKAFF